MTTQRTIQDDELACSYLKQVNSERNKLSLYWSDIQEATGTSPSAFHEYAHGRRWPHPKRYNRIADFFHWPHYQPGRKLSQPVSKTQVAIPFDGESSSLPLYDPSKQHIIITYVKEFIELAEHFKEALLHDEQ